MWSSIMETWTLVLAPHKHLHLWSDHYAKDMWWYFVTSLMMLFSSPNFFFMNYDIPWKPNVVDNHKSWKILNVISEFFFFFLMCLRTKHFPHVACLDSIPTESCCPRNSDENTAQTCPMVLFYAWIFPLLAQ